MSIYLVQHGKSLSKDQDPQKGISDQGKEDSIRIAQVAKMYKINVSRILHSGKKRAEQTAMIFHEYLEPEKAIGKQDGIAPMDDVKIFAQNLKTKSDIMYVGHLPFMEKLVSYLATGSEEYIVFKFQNSGIVCMEQHTGDITGWNIKWALMPRID
ncbi:MAG: phosphohistidine phosphatase SixA [Proteobacteria bacterium]|nr:phosphohistidine phosphatase SixA [Pseudomonadota bacterium]